MERKPYHSMSKLTETVERVRRGVVYVVCGESAGTGFVLHPSGLVATALHVVGTERAAQPKVRLWQHEPVQAKVVATESNLDVAVLRVPMPECQHDHIFAAPKDPPILKTGADVAYTGYTFGPRLYGVPVLSTHRGIISSVFPIDFAGERLWFYHIDGLVNEGLSGSPVYCPETGALVALINKHFGPHLSLKGTGIGGAVPIAHLIRAVSTIVAD